MNRRLSLLAVALVVVGSSPVEADPLACSLDQEIVTGCAVLAPGDYAEVRTSTVVQVEPVTGVPRPPGAGCTLGVLVQDTRGQRYFTYAGHCAVGAAKGARLVDRGGYLVGTLAFSVRDHTRGLDIALVRVAKGRRVSPAVRGWGGPTGLLTGAVGGGALAFAGSSAPGAVQQGRATSTPGIDRTFSFRVGPEPAAGDSGAPLLLADGRLAGEFIGFLNGSGDADGEDPRSWREGPTYAFRMDRQLAEAAKAIGTRLRLLTAPLLVR